MRRYLVCNTSDINKRDKMNSFGRNTLRSEMNPTLNMSLIWLFPPHKITTYYIPHVVLILFLVAFCSLFSRVLHYKSIQSINTLNLLGITEPHNYRATHFKFNTLRELTDSMRRQILVAMLCVLIWFGYQRNVYLDI